MPKKQSRDTSPRPPTASLLAPDLVIAEVKEIAAAATKAEATLEQLHADMGRLLNQIWAGKLHKTAGYDEREGFRKYVETELGIGYRRAMYLATIYGYLEELGLTRGDISGVGWSMLREIVGGKTTRSRTNQNSDDGQTRDRIASLIEFARSHTRAELIAHLETLGVERQTSMARPPGRKRGKPKLA